MCPHLASGAGMAIEDAIVLAAELSSSDTLEQALSGFTARRYDRCKHVIDKSVRLGELEMSHGSPLEDSRRMSESLRALHSPI